MRARGWTLFQAFTLVELLIAMTITMLMVTMIMRVFSGTAAAWKQTEARTDTFREARAALEIMGRDLSIAAGAANIPMVVLGNSTGTGTKPEDKVNNEIYVSSFIANSGKSDLCTVGYFCRWDDTQKCYILKRLYNDSNATFKNFTDYQNSGGIPPIPFDKLYTGFGSYNGLSYKNNVEDDAASYIWDLQFSAFYNNAPVAYPAYPASLTYSDPLPSWVEVRFKAISAQSIQKLKSMTVTRDTWNPASNIYSPTYKTAIMPYQQQFVMRIPMLSAR